MLSNNVNNDVRRGIYLRIRLLDGEIIKKMEWLTNNISHVDFDRRFRDYNNLLIKRDAAMDALEQMDGKYITRSKYQFDTETLIF